MVLIIPPAAATCPLSPRFLLSALSDFPLRNDSNYCAHLSHLSPSSSFHHDDLPIIMLVVAVQPEYERVSLLSEQGKERASEGELFHSHLLEVSTVLSRINGR